MSDEKWKTAQDALEKAEKLLAGRQYSEARRRAFEAGKAVVEAYAEDRPAVGGLTLAEKAKALELPFEVFAVCDKLDQEDPAAPKKMLPVRPEGELAEERVHQARSLVRFLKWAHEEPPGVAT